MIVLKYNKQDLTTKIERSLKILKEREEVITLQNQEKVARVEKQCEALLISWAQDVEGLYKKELGLFSSFKKPPLISPPHLASRLHGEEFFSMGDCVERPGFGVLFFDGLSVLPEDVKKAIGYCDRFAWVYIAIEKSFNHEIRTLEVALARLSDDAVMPDIEIDSDNDVLISITLAEKLKQGVV